MLSDHQVWATVPGLLVVKVALVTSSPATTSLLSTPSCRRTTRWWTRRGWWRAWTPPPPSTMVYCLWMWRVVDIHPVLTAVHGYHSLVSLSQPFLATTPGLTRVWQSPTWTPSRTSGTSSSPPSSPSWPAWCLGLPCASCTPSASTSVGAQPCIM